MTEPAKTLQRRVLIVDDDSDYVNIVNCALKWEGYDTSVASSGEEALEKMSGWNPHVILLDMSMPGLTGVETMEQVRQSEEYVAVIFVSADSKVDDIIRGLEAGADDYIVKPFDPRELIARVRAQIRIKDLNDRLRIANKRLQELINIDDLTGLFNMRSFYDRLDNELARGRRFGRCVCVAMLDMDNFKTVNDGHDHLFGSFVLAEVGKLIKDSIRSIDFAARYGGDEFLIVLTETEEEGAALFCDRLRKKLETKVFLHGTDQTSRTASVGFVVAHPRQRDIDARDIVRAADRALYRAKEQGKNRVCKYNFENPDSPEDLERYRRNRRID